MRLLLAGCLLWAGPAFSNPRLPDTTCTGPLVVRLVFHFLARQTPVVVPTGTGSYLDWGNFTEIDDGRGGTGTNAFAFAEDVVRTLRQRQDENVLNTGSTYPTVPPKGYTFTLAGVYVNRTDDDDLRLLELNNQGDNRLHDTYGVARDSVINVYLQERGASASYKLGGVAGRGPAIHYFGYGPPSATTMWFKMKNVWLLYHGSDRNVAAVMAGNLAHELGHLLDLAHTETEPVQCPDAPTGMGTGSDNNVMRSGSGNACALTPCQVAIVQRTLRTTGRAYVYSCGPRATAVAELPTEVGPNAPLILDARASFGDVAHSLTIDRMRPSGKSRRLVEQHRDTAAGRLDLRTLHRFRPGTYRVKLTTAGPAGQPGAVAVRVVRVRRR